MGAYQQEADEIVQRYWLGQIDGQQCLDALDCALAAVVRTLGPQDLEAAIALTFFNARLVTMEIAWRSGDGKASRATPIHRAALR